MRLISTMDIIGHLAQWAVRQHPYHAPERLFEFVQDVLAKCSTEFKDGFPELPMQRFASHGDLRKWLHDAFEGHATLTAWNTPRSGHTLQAVFSSRHNRPFAEDDFIDIVALWGNVARGVWDETREFDVADALPSGNPAP